MQKISGGWGACPRGHALRASGPPPFYFPGSAPVKAAKYHLKRVLGDHRLNYDDLETVIIQVEACLNSRPLGAMASHPLDGICPLTPGHFLIGRALM